VNNLDAKLFTRRDSGGANMFTTRAIKTVENHQAGEATTPKTSDIHPPLKVDQVRSLSMFGRAGRATGRMRMMGDAEGHSPAKPRRSPVCYAMDDEG